MSTMLSQVTSEPVIRPPRIVIHGPGGAGKTTFGAFAPDVLYMPAEDGEGILSYARLPRPLCFADVINSIAELVKEKHKFKSLVIDSVDHIEPLIWSQVCEDDGKGKTNVEQFGFGKGYVLADTHWLKLFRGLDMLREQGMTTIVLAHSATVNHDDPLVGTYSRTAPKLHKRAQALLYEWADVVGCLHIERIAVDRGEEGGRTTRTAQASGQRVLQLEDNGALVAKNRYSLPASLRIPKGEGYQILRAEILKALNPTPEKEAA